MGWLNSIISYLFKNKTSDKITNVIPMGGSWGNAINWQNFDRRVVVGWMNPKPKKGSYISSNMRSGRTMIFKITKVDPCGNPADMFFANVVDVGYSDEIFNGGNKYGNRT